MRTDSTFTVLLAVIAVAVVSFSGINAAYAYSGSVSAGANTVGAEWLSIDYCKSDGTSISGGDYIQFTVDGEPSILDGHIEYNPPAGTLALRISGDQAYSVNMIGAFSCGSSNPGYGAAIKSVKVIFDTDIDCELGGNHSGLAPTVLNPTLANPVGGVYTYTYTIQKIVVYLVNDAYLQTDASGNVYVSVDGAAGTSVPLSDMKDLNKLDLLFHVDKA